YIAGGGTKVPETSKVEQRREPPFVCIGSLSCEPASQWVHVEDYDRRDQNRGHRRPVEMSRVRARASLVPGLEHVPPARDAERDEGEEQRTEGNVVAEVLIPCFEQAVDDDRKGEHGNQKECRLVGCVPGRPVKCPEPSDERRNRHERILGRESPEHEEARVVQKLPHRLSKRIRAVGLSGDIEARG